MQLTPDGARYLAVAAGRRAPRPFCWRWLIPTVCRDLEWRWRVASYAGVVGTAVGAGFLAPTWRAGLAVGAMVLALPMSRFNLKAPVLVDAPAMALSVAAAALWVNGLHVEAVAVAVLAGNVKETAPVFAALYAWTPWLLVGIAPVVVLALVRRPGPDVLDERNAEILAHPLRTGIAWHLGPWLDPAMMLWPWGGALVALGCGDWRVAVVAVVAYAQTLVATDTVRLYQWAAPVVCVAAVGLVPLVWLPALVAATVWNPWRGDGI